MSRFKTFFYMIIFVGTGQWPLIFQQPDNTSLVLYIIIHLHIIPKFIMLIIEALPFL